MNVPEDIGAGVAGGFVAFMAAVIAIFRARLSSFLGCLVQLALNDNRGGTLFDYRKALDDERAAPRKDIDRLTGLVDDITERVRALEETATSWKVADVVNTNEVNRLQADVQRIATRIGTDMDGLRDLLLEVLKRTR